MTLDGKIGRSISTGWNPIATDDEKTRNIVPIKFYEYMAMGTPVITTKLPGVMKEFGEGNGVVYVDKPEDALRIVNVDMYERMSGEVVYVDKPEDALWKAVELIEGGVISEYGPAARGFVENYGWGDVVDEFEGILEGVVRSD